MSDQATYFGANGWLLELAGRRILVDPWPRPVLLNGKAVLLTQESRGDNAEYGWELLPKEAIRRY